MIVEDVSLDDSPLRDAPVLAARVDPDRDRRRGRMDRLVRGRAPPERRTRARLVPHRLLDCISSNWCEQCRHLFWTLSAFMLNGMGGWLVSLVVGYFMSEWVFR